MWFLFSVFMCSCMRCVWEKEWSLQCSAFCCQETVPGLWPPSNYTAAPVYMEIFFQTVAAGTQGWVLSLDVLKYLGRGAWVLPLSFIFYLLYPSLTPQPRKQGSHCGGCAVEDNRWIHPKRRGEKKGKHKVKSVCECEFSPRRKPAVYGHSLPCEWQVE